MKGRTQKHTNSGKYQEGGGIRKNGYCVGEIDKEMRERDCLIQYFFYEKEESKLANERKSFCGLLLYAGLKGKCDCLSYNSVSCFQ